MANLSFAPVGDGSGKDGGAQGKRSTRGADRVEGCDAEIGQAEHHRHLQDTTLENGSIHSPCHTD